MKTLYVGIDVSKLTLDVALTIDGKKTLVMKKLTNNSAGFKVLEEWTRKRSEKDECHKIHFLIEATGIYSDSLAEYLYSREDLKVTVINPAQVKSFGKSILLRTKTDKIDAELLASYAAMIRPEATVKTPDEIKKLKSIVRELQFQIDLRAKIKTRLESAIDLEIAELIEQDIQYYNEKVKNLEKRIRDHIKNHKLLKEKIDLLRTIQGIGERSAQLILCEFHNEDGTGKISAKAQTAHAGLAPQQKLSGISVNGKPKICKTGNKRLRKGLYLPALTAIRQNQVIKEFYERLLKNGKKKMVALVAAMRKLLVIAIGVLNNKTPFDPNWKNSVQFA